MKHLKNFGIVVIAAAALMAFSNAGTASATEATCSKGVMCANGAAFEATSTHLVIRGIFGIEVTCEHSLIRGAQTNTGSSTETVEVALSSFVLTKCINGWETTTLKPGKLIIHTDEQDPTGASGNATVTSKGMEITVENKSLGGLHCIYTTTVATDVGTFDGSSTTGKTATWTIEGTIARTGGRSGSFCGANVQWIGDYTILAPDFLDIH